MRSVHRIKTGDVVMLRKSASEVLEDDEQHLAGQFAMISACAFSEYEYVYDLVFHDQKTKLLAVPAEWIRVCIPE